MAWLQACRYVSKFAICMDMFTTSRQGYGKMYALDFTRIIWKTTNDIGHWFNANMTDENKISFLSGSTRADQAKPKDSADTWKASPLNHESHIHYNCHAEVLVDGHDVYHGFVKDTSLRGALLYLEHNVEKVQFIKLHIHIPPLGANIHSHVFEVSAIVNATVYDSSEECFRSSIRFTEFTLESDKAYLQSYISRL